MFKKILVPLDGSASATAALIQAIEVAKAFQASLTVASVYDANPYIAAAAEYGYSQPQYAEEVRVEANNNVLNARNIASRCGVIADKMVVECGKTWRGILDTADHGNFDLIVMGSNGRTGLDKLVMGSVTQNVLQRTRLPVLVVRK